MQQLLAVEKKDTVSDEERLAAVYQLKKEFERCHFPHDSTYARLLHRVGVFLFNLNNGIATSQSIFYTKNAIRINLSGRKAASPVFAVNSFKNLAFNFETINQFRQALAYYDSTILYGKQFAGQENFIIKSRYRKVLIFFRNGDYQKMIDESTIGITEARGTEMDYMLPAFYNQRAQAYYFQSQLQQATTDLDSALANPTLQDDAFELANTLLIKALVAAKRGNNPEAIGLFNKAVTERIADGTAWQIADDYTDFGNFYLNQVHDAVKAKQCYLKTIEYALKEADKERLAKAHLNLGYADFTLSDLAGAEQFYMKAFQDLDVLQRSDLLYNTTANKLALIPNKELLLAALGNKTELLLTKYKTTGDKKFLASTLKTALLTDSMITQVRHEQLGEQSKLYWRSKAREFFTNAMEACYLAQDPVMTFYFMEKSRAVLLNDKLNEIGAAAFLPPTEAAQEEALQLKIADQLQKLSYTDKSSAAYAAQHYQLLQSQYASENFIKALEQKYPLYYQYKYADKVTSLDTLKKYLGANKASFIHYFINDTVVYALTITAGGTKMLKVTTRDFDSRELTKFLHLCSDKQELNSHYGDFASLSYAFYNTLFQPLQIPKGRVVICADNFLIPFEALSTDTEGRHFLLYDYTFSYVYSARNLLNRRNLTAAKGDFLGMAPASFSTYLGVPDLKQSAVALNASSSHYHSVKLFVNKDASSHNFLQQLPFYSVVNIFSHAGADTGDNEPLLYMNDSVIHLSQLQAIANPAARLVILSACETNVGRNATGEGIYSLARGLAGAGIPAVSATLWKADEATIYAVTELFNSNLAKGMQKDDALRQAKLTYLNNNSTERSLPYYWANMILVGDTSPVEFAGQNNSWLWMVAGGVLVLILYFAWNRKKKRSR